MRQTHHLDLTLADTPLVLDRVVSLCRARQCTILALRYETADRHRPGRVSLTLAGTSRMARIVVQRLAALPGVLAVAHVGERAQMHIPGVTQRAQRAAART